MLKDTWRGNDDEAQLPDGDPGLDFGTSVRAGADAVTDFGRLKSYAWTFELQPVIEWVLTEGPVVLGTNWYSSFARPDAAGIVRTVPNARVVGGHAYLLRAVDTRRALARCSNSWGDGWGLSGEFLLPLRDLERLMHEDGEACSAVQKAAQRPGGHAEGGEGVRPAGGAGRVEKEETSPLGRRRRGENSFPYFFSLR